MKKRNQLGGKQRNFGATRISVVLQAFYSAGNSLQAVRKVVHNPWLLRCSMAVYYPAEQPEHIKGQQYLEKKCQRVIQ